MKVSKSITDIIRLLGVVLPIWVVFNILGYSTFPLESKALDVISRVWRAWPQLIKLGAEALKKPVHF